VLIAQITDTHIGFEPGNPDERNALRLMAILDRLITGPDRPDLVLLSGDLVEHGDAASYARLADLLAPCPFPVRLMVGNHDERAAMLAAFPETPVVDGFVQSVAEFPGLRLITLDTLEPGRHGGAFCEARAAWLAARLDDEPGVPAIIAVHHPPVETGLAWLDGAKTAPWIARLAHAIAGRPQVRAIIAGHLHRTITAMWNGVMVGVCPSSAPPVSLDLRDIDPARPDDRAMIVEAPPGYALHRWDGTSLVSHFESVAVGRDWPVLARYTPAMQDIIAIMARERET
jgi:Icc protein